MLVVVPLPEEMRCLLKHFSECGLRTVPAAVGRLRAARVPGLGLTVAPGGLGKAQFAAQAQHLIDAGESWDLLLCVGAAGALVDDIDVGDVVVATETVEHDIRNRFGKPLAPRFRGDERAVETLRRLPVAPGSFRVHFGPIASGDEDIVDAERRREVQELTGALAVAWEGAGGARACRFSRLPYVEIRGVTDTAGATAALDFEANLQVAMGNVAAVVALWAGCGMGVVPR